MTEAPAALDQLTAAIGPTLGVHLAQCKGGGYIVVVDGTIHAACSALPDAVDCLHDVASERFGESTALPQGIKPAPRPTMPVEQPSMPQPTSYGLGPHPMTRGVSTIAALVLLVSVFMTRLAIA